MTAFPNVTYPAFTSITMPAGFQSLAHAASIMSTGVIDNTEAAVKAYDSIVLLITLASLNPTGVPQLAAALVPTYDGTNYQTLAGTTFPLGSDSVPVAGCNIDPGTGAKFGYIQFFQCCDPIKYKVIVQNLLNVPLASSGNTVGWSGTLRQTR